MAPVTKRARKKEGGGDPQPGGLQKWFGAGSKDIAGGAKEAADGQAPVQVPDVPDAAEQPSAPQAALLQDNSPVKGFRKLFSVQAGKSTPATHEALQDEAKKAAASASSPTLEPLAAITPPPAVEQPKPAAGVPTEEKQLPQLNEEQLRRIEENRRKARERQQAKRKSQEERPAEEAPPAASPSRPAAMRPSPNQEAVTPKKVTLPAQERRQSPAAAAAAAPAPEATRSTALAGQWAAGAGGSRFSSLECGTWMQYNSLYAARLKQLRAAAMEEARALWGGIVPPQNFLADLSGYRQSGEGSEVVLAGVLFKDLKLRLNVIDQYKDVKVVGNLGEGSSAEAMRKLCSSEDVLWLEDGMMRLLLVLPREQVARLTTGIIAGVRGIATNDGNFNVKAVCFPRMGSPPPLASLAAAATAEQGPFLALASGLAFGREAADVGLAAARGRAVDFLLGRSGGQEALPSGAVQHLILCGGTLAAGVSGAILKSALREADEMLAQLAARVRLDVMPGRGEPTNLCLPQAALHPHLFRRVRECRDFRSVSNPHECKVQGMSILGHSGQPVEDMLRCSELPSPLEALMTCLEAGHLAPTAPDTLATQPFTDSDPFIINELPHVLFSGGHDRQYHQWHASPRGTGGTLCVCVPAFHRQPAVVLVSLRDPRHVSVHEFRWTEVQEAEGPMDSKAVEQAGNLSGDALEGAVKMDVEATAGVA